MSSSQSVFITVLGDVIDDIGAGHLLASCLLTPESSTLACYWNGEKKDSR